MSRSVFVLGLIAAALMAPTLALPDSAFADGARATTPAEQADGLIAAMKGGNAEERAKAALQAIKNPSASLLQPLLRLLSDPEAGVREAATKALGTRATAREKKKAASSLNPRLGRLGRRAQDHDELMVVIAALHKLAQKSSIKPLLDGIKLETEAEETTARLNAVAAVPHADAIDRLIQFLARGRRGDARKQRNAAAKALQYATGMRLGHDPDKWRKWWRENKKTFSFEALARAREEAEAERQAKAQRKKERRENKGKKKKRKKDGGSERAPD